MDERIIGIRKSEAWKEIETGNTAAVRNIFDNDFPKDEVKRILIHEQHGLCAYCMRRIKDDSHSRVEHLVPLSEDKENSINYNNMLGVCDGGEKASEQKGKCNSTTIKKLMDTLYDKEEREEYVGVKLFYFAKKYKSLVKRGL
ncbi:MAG: hypothetical protein ACI4TF_16805 [Oliverpabstia sp.]